MLMKEIKDDTNKWRDVPFLNSKNQYYQNYSTTQGVLQIQYDPYELPMVFFTELEQQQQKILKTFMET